MKKNLYTLLAGCAAFIMACSKPMVTNPDQVSLVKKWETEAILSVPESVLFDKARNVLYVSNINGSHDGKDGNGFISKLSTSGKIEELEWAKGLDAPKGMGLVKDLLYVADITKVIVIDTKTGQKVKEIEPAGAKFLNDITVDAQGNVYVSDSSGNKVYKLTNDVATVYVESQTLKQPNGLLASAGKMYVIDMGSGIFYNIDAATQLVKAAEGLAGGDGIVPVGKGDFLVSNWNGEVNYVTASGQVTKLLDTKTEKMNAADIEFLPKGNLVLVPTFFGNSVVAYELKNK